MSTEGTKQITARQNDLLSFIEGVAGSEHRMPSYREMAAALKLSAVGSVQDLISALVEKGYLVKSGKHLLLSEKRQGPVLHVPLVGVVAAGQLSEAIENNLGVVPISSDILSHKTKSKTNAPLFALRVRGLSMVEAGILEGDVVIVQAGVSVDSGDTVVARYEGEATVKEIYFKSKDRAKEIVLHPRNSSMKDMIFSQKDSSDLEILGKVLAVQRVL